MNNQFLNEKLVALNFTKSSNFLSQVHVAVDRGSETQLHVTENLVVRAVAVKV